MAYGKIKADTITYDNSGSDVDTTIASLVAPKEGTAIVSTGESGTTKFLRVDGDGTCSWQVPPDTNTQLTLIDEDDMASNDNTKPPSQQSVKAYVDTKAPTNNPTFTGTVNAAALTLSGDLTVGGTTTTVNSATLEVTDKNIEIGKVSTPTDVTADGGGITLKGTTDKTITWTDATDTWDFNQDVKIINDTNVGITFTHQGATAEIQFTANSVDEAGEIRVGESTGGGVMQFKTKTTGGTLTQALELGTDQSATFAGTVSDSKGDLRKIVIHDVTTNNYTCVASDAGKSLWITGNITIPHNVFSAGDAITFVGNGAAATLLIPNLTCYNAADASTGNRQLAERGIATIIFVTPNQANISGSGLT